MGKKAFSILLMFVVLLSTGGLTITRHFCSGEAVSVAVNAQAESCCDDGNCCHNETSFVKLQDNFLVVDKMALSEDFSLQVIPCLVFNDNLSSGASFVLGSFTAESPPPLIQRQLSLFQSFLL